MRNDKSLFFIFIFDILLYGFFQGTEKWVLRWWEICELCLFAFESKRLCHMVVAGCLKIFVIYDLFCPGHYCSGLGVTLNGILRS